MMSSLQPSADLERAVWGALAMIDDPEMPIGIVELGIVQRVEVQRGSVHVVITPTYTGCVALEMISEQIRKSLASLPGVEQVHVEQVFHPPWTPDRITPSGKERLRRHGVTVASNSYVQLGTPQSRAQPCPYCGSIETRVESPFGPTRCRMVYYCGACHNTFEHIKAL